MFATRAVDRTGQYSVALTLLNSVALTLRNSFASTLRERVLLLHLDETAAMLQTGLAGTYVFVRLQWLHHLSNGDIAGVDGIEGGRVRERMMDV